MGEQSAKMKFAVTDYILLQIMVAATLQRPMELKAEQEEGALWEVHRVEAKVRPGR